MFVHSIIDFAYFENQIIALKQKLYSFGIGIGIQTSAGIIKFSIANGNAENQDFNFSNTKATAFDAPPVPRIKAFV